MPEEPFAPPDMPHGSAQDIERTQSADASPVLTPAPTEAPAVSDAPPAACPQLAAALELISQLPQLSLERHPHVYERVHAELSGALAEINDA